MHARMSQAAGRRAEEGGPAENNPLCVRRSSPQLESPHMLRCRQPIGCGRSPWIRALPLARTVPCAKSEGLPIGMMLVGGKWAESTLVRTGQAFEETGVYSLRIER